MSFDHDKELEAYAKWLEENKDKRQSQEEIDFIDRRADRPQPHVPGMELPKRKSALKRPGRKPEPQPEQRTEIEFAGMKFAGGKMFVLLTALSSLGGAAWAGFEFYNDYRNMKEVVANIDTTEIENRNKLIEQKLDDAIEYSRDIKDDLRDQINVLDNNVRRVEKLVRESEQTVRQQITDAEKRFETKRDALQNDYDQKASALRDRTDQKLVDLEERLSTRIQRALDNPLAN